jgi:hypothetical protein
MHGSMILMAIILSPRIWKFKIGDYISNYISLIYGYLQEVQIQFSEEICEEVRSLPALYRY